MPVFGAPLREACRDGCGGVPRVVAETIAWLDAHGASRPDRTFLFPSRVRLGGGARPRRAVAVRPPRRRPERLSRAGFRRRASSRRARAPRPARGRPVPDPAPRPRVVPSSTSPPTVIVVATKHETSGISGIRAVAVKPVPGLHRVPGDTRVVAECASRYDEREVAPLRGVRDARAVASVLKLYLDALPSPLLRASASDGPDANATGPAPAAITAIAETQRERGHEAALTALRAFVAKRLPVCNRDALRATCAHLRRVARAEAHSEAAKKRRSSIGAVRQSARTLAAAFGKTLCGESLGCSEAGAVVELLLEHHDFVFGVSRTATDRAFATIDTSDANDETRKTLGDKENVSVVAKGSKKAPEGDFGADFGGIRPARDVDSCDVDSATLDVVRAFFDGDDGVCAEADRALGGSLCQWLFSTSEDVERMSREALRREKTAIKRRLRAFDVSVERDSRGARSTKEDKKHLRPLYLRLARVKRRMQIEANAEGDARRVS